MLAALGVLAALVSAGLLMLLSPWLKAYALARPNARSSHTLPTPQGGGAAVVAATCVTIWAGVLAFGPFPSAATNQLLVLTGSTLLLAIVGAIDDIRGLSPSARLALQGLAVAGVIASLPPDWQVFHFLPWWIERIVLVVGGVWFVNLTNFMDGIDWMTVAEVVPITGAMVAFGFLGVIDLPTLLTAVALLGATIGFAPFNKPVARLFLGDVGSLPIGLLLCWLLLQLAGRGHLAAAVLLGLYYAADATITLLQRLFAGEPIWQAHRSHFYQRALDRGFTVPDVVCRVFAVNLALAVLALASLWSTGLPLWALLLAGLALVGWLLTDLTRGKG